MSARTVIRVVALATALSALPTNVRAQDVELRARGRPLPAAYFERIRQDPNFFEIDRGWTAKHTLTPDAAVIQGTLPLVVVQALFADSPEPWITPQSIQRIIFDGPTPHGTLTEFYREISGGRLHVTGRVLPWVRTTITRQETVGTSFGLGAEAKTGVFLVQALAAADPSVDFGQFDNDGADGVPNSGDDDGYVDAVAFQFIERAGSCGGEGIWPHRSRIAGWGAQTGGAYVSNDRRPNGQPVLVDGYIIQSTVLCEGTEPLTASVIAHELGHVLGLPDLYHAANGILPSQRRWVVGCWTLMAAGSWGCGDGASFGHANRPPHMGPWEKSVLGWINEQIVGPDVRDQEFVLSPVQTSGRSLRVPLGTGEYLQLEYRPQRGFDIGLPVSGVLIYHIDLTRPLYPNASGPRIYRVKLVEADGDEALLRTSLEGGNRGVAADAWALGATGRFSAVTLPPLRRNSGALATVTLHAITIDGDVARVRLSTAPQPAIVTAAPLALGTALTPGTSVIRAVGGALPYQFNVVGTLPSGLGTTVNGEQLLMHGTPLEAGTFPFQLRITDAIGVTVTEPFSITVAPAQIETSRLLQPFLRSAAQPLSPAEESYLDNSGNRNGRYDVGDLRRQLRAVAN